MKLTAELVEAFAGTFLSPRYDEPVPTPAFHRKVWEAYCSDHPQVVCAAPRDHAKSTAFTFDFVICSVMFRASDYVIIIGASEEKAIEQLVNISSEIHDNADLQKEFGVDKFLVDQKGEVVIRFSDGHLCRLLARGSEQKIRGSLWNGKRPNLIVGDDLEDDEQVENPDRRRKFRKWFFRAAKQALSRSGRIRVHGTILHEDSLLMRLIKNSTWKHLFFSAHQSFDDFSNILWEEKWSAEALRRRRDEFVQDGDAAGYSQEFLNDPLDNDERYFQLDDFLPMNEDDYGTDLLVCAAADFAVSKADKADSTSFSIGGKSLDNRLMFIDQRKGRWDALRIVDELFAVQQAYNPQVFFVEDGVIWKALAPMVYREMQERDCWINIKPRLPIKDKATRARSLQRRMRAHGCRFDKKADWYASFENELTRFTGYARAVHDDQVDSAALLSLGFDEISQIVKEDFYSDEEIEYERNDRKVQQAGRSRTTGY